MLFSRDWLADHVELPADPQELADRLTLSGFAVEHVEEKDGDVLFDIDVTTNRTDCMNHRGLAREIAVLFERPLRDFPTAPAAGGGVVGEAAAAVDVEEPEACPRFVARVIRGVRIGESPAWLKKRLTAIGLRPINNVVDITNYVLWETGQPLHAYDLAKLAGSRLVVRRAREGEKLTTLDGVERQLSPQMLVIADAEKPVGLGGVMGGLDSEVTAATVDVLLEGAHFDRKTVRAAARGLGMHTDASHRFERGADPGGCRAAVDRAAGLMAELAGGTVLAGAIDVDHPEHYAPRRGRLDLTRLAAFAGAEIGGDDAVRWLTALGFNLTPAGDGVFDVTVPSWRYYDFEPRTAGRTLVYEADLFEEVVRVFGFDRIPNALPEIPGTDGPRTEAQLRRDLARRHLAACGFAEAVHYAFLDPAAEAVFPNLSQGPALKLANPLSELYSVLRRSLVPNLVASARFNQRRGAASVRLFEVATVFFDRPGAGFPDQPEHLGLVAGGRVGQPWDHSVELDLFDLKGVVESLAAAAGAGIEWRPADLPGLSPGSAAQIFRAGPSEASKSSGQPIGFLGRVLEEEGYPLYVAELALPGLAATANDSNDRTVTLPSKLPGISVDFTFPHARSTPWTEIEQAVKGLAVPELVSFGLKDRYSGAGVPEGAVNTTIYFFYNAADRSLTQDEVNAWQAKLTGSLVERFGLQG